jgi:hypothetical protein
MATALCDFCSEPSVVFRYPAQNFIAYVAAGVAGESVGDWAACKICHELIQAGDRAGLSERSVRTLLEKHPEMQNAEAELRAQLTDFHRRFFANRAGAPVPVVVSPIV